MRATLIVLAGGLAIAACQAQHEVAAIAPPAPPMWAQGVRDGGFPIKPRPECSAEVRAARDASTVAAIAARGGTFTCGGLNSPLPLDDAVMADDLARVRALLDAHADPNAHWLDKGDRFPLEEALQTHGSGITELLLQRGADPNQRWCPFESRGGDPATACTSAAGVTPLIMAAAYDDPQSTFLLLRAGADPRLEGPSHGNALDFARGETVFYLLLSSIVPHGTRADALAYISRRNPRDPFEGPWDDTPLTRTVVGAIGGVMLPPPPPPSQAPASGFERLRGLNPTYASDRVGRVRALLALGADPNERLTGNVDWTPLGLAVKSGDSEVVEVLLRRGADANARWCVPLALDANWHPLQMEAGCVLARGITPLMAAASLGAQDVVDALLRGGADPALKDWRNQTAFDYAVRTRHTDIAAELTQVVRWKARFG
jgi:ankyrin repeat protein